MTEEKTTKARVRARIIGSTRLLSGTTFGAVSMLGGLTCGNLVPPPSERVCFDVSPRSAEVLQYGYASWRSDDGCYRLESYRDVEVSAPHYCPETFSVYELRSVGQVTLSPAPCIDGGGPSIDAGAVGTDSGSPTDAAVPDADVGDAGSQDASTDAALPAQDAT